MPRIDEAVLPRTLAVGGLVAVGLFAVRGHLPGAEPPPNAAAPTDSAAGGTASLGAIVAMLAVSVAVIVLAVVTQARRRPVRSAAGELPRSPGDRAPVSWRLVAVAAAVLAVWVVAVLFLMRLTHPLTLGGAPADAGSVRPPEPVPGQPAPADADPGRGAGGGVFEAFAAATIALFVLSLAAAVVVNRRRPSPPDTAVTLDAPVRSPRPAGPDLARAAEVGLAEIGDRSRDAQEAIIACYVAMERELAKSPGTLPRDSDTPTEVLERAASRHVLDPTQAMRLVDLFEEARFSPHVMDESHRDDAERALGGVLSALQGAP